MIYFKIFKYNSNYNEYVFVKLGFHIIKSALSRYNHFWTFHKLINCRVYEKTITAISNLFLKEIFVWQSCCSSCFTAESKPLIKSAVW